MTHPADSVADRIPANNEKEKATTTRELLRLDEERARNKSVAIPYLGKPITREQIFVIAPKKMRCALPSNLRGTFSRSGLRNLRKVARSLTTPKVVHEILAGPAELPYPIHRITFLVD